MTATQADSEQMISRRGVMRTTAIGIGAATGMGALGSTAGTVEAVNWGDVGTVAASTVLGGPVGLGWALRETAVFGSDPPAEGLTADALKQQIYQAMTTRKSVNASTFIDNQNILDGVESTAYTDAKIAAIEELNAGSAESAVLDAATNAIDSYEKTVRSNFIKSWNESVREFDSFLTAISSHGSADDYLRVNGQSAAVGGVRSYSYPDGTNIDILRVQQSNTNNHRYDFGDGASGDSAGFNDANLLADQSDFDYLKYNDWNPVWSEMNTVFTNVRNGVATWVNNVYASVQSGDIAVSELVTPRERAAMLSDEETKAQAIADLAALNIPFDAEREATISISETGATLTGTIGLSDDSDGPIKAGVTYDPSTFAGDVYLTADMSGITGKWTEYQSGVDGGTITLTAEPYDGVIYEVTTTAGETVSVPSDSWTGDDSGSWTYDATGDLETNITEVDSITYTSGASEAKYETLRLTRPFTVKSIVNTETGESAGSLTFTKSEPQTDSNYITQEEWSQLEKQNQELIDKFEESQDSGGTGGAGGGFFGGDSPDLGLVAAAVGGLGVVYALFGQGDA